MLYRAPLCSHLIAEECFFDITLFLKKGRIYMKVILKDGTAMEVEKGISILDLAKK